MIKTPTIIVSLLLLLLCFTTVSCKKEAVTIVQTTESEPWQINTSVALSTSEDTDKDVVIDTKNTGQTINGFGACFNELGWEALQALSENDRTSIMEEFFIPNKGGNFTICRMPLGANDFSNDWYSYNETENDFEMHNFSIENDLQTLVPYIQSALSINPSLKMWASPWCPPSWMKWNKHYACATSGEWLADEFQNNLAKEKQGAEGTNMFIQEEKYFEAYALYFSKFIDAYKEQNIVIEMVMPQNEWNSCQVFPSCTWTASGLAEFIGSYLGPSMDQKKVQVMLGTMERPTDTMVDTIMNHAKAKKYIKGIGFQWAGKDALPAVHNHYKNMPLLQTEQECGDGKNDWKHCQHAWHLMKHYLSNGVGTYLYWNMALKEGGISRWGWSQNSLVTINPEHKTFQYNNEYYLLKHVSHFVKPQAKRLYTDGNYDNLLAFINPDQSVVLMLANEQSQEQQISINVDGKRQSIQLKPNSFTTIHLEG